MSTVAFFGHNAYDAANRRRAVAFARDGVQVVGFMMRRQDVGETLWRNVDLGRTFDANYPQRAKSIFTGARIAAAHKELLSSCDLIYARNLDMLACAMLACKLSSLRRPVIYECLDVHALLAQRGLAGTLFRQAEARLLRHCARVVISSPGYEREYFRPHHPKAPPLVMIENRLVEGDAFGPRPTTVAAARSGPLRLGWFGNLRCPRSAAVLEAVKDAHGDAVDIQLRGYFTHFIEADVRHRLIDSGKAHFGGRYRAPEDLGAIYDSVDLVWSVDFFDAGMNSSWLLPNRIYEGGYFGVPAIAFAGTETGRWVEKHRVGFAIGEALEVEAVQLIGQLLKDRSLVADRRRALMSLPNETFVQPRNFLAAIIDDVIAEAQVKREG